MFILCFCTVLVKQTKYFKQKSTENYKMDYRKLQKKKNNHFSDSQFSLW